MKFFKENDYKGKEVPAFPTGDGGVKAVEYGFETVHPCVCPLDFPSLLIHLLIKQPILLRFSSISWIGTYIGNYAVRYERASEFRRVKASVKVAEEAIYGNIRINKLADNLLNSFVYPVDIGVIPCLGFGHGERNSLIVREKERIGCTSFLSALIFSLLSASIYGRMRAVDMGEGQVKLVFVPVQNLGIDFLPFLFLTPFAVMVEDCLPARTLPAEKMTDREHTPLAAALELVEYGVYDLNKVKFGGIIICLSCTHACTNGKKRVAPSNITLNQSKTEEIGQMHRGQINPFSYSFAKWAPVSTIDRTNIDSCLFFDLIHMKPVGNSIGDKYIYFKEMEDTVTLQMKNYCNDTLKIVRHNDIWVSVKRYREDMLDFKEILNMKLPTPIEMIRLNFNDTLLILTRQTWKGDDSLKLGEKNFTPCLATDSNYFKGSHWA